jgi:insulysin
MQVTKSTNDKREFKAIVLKNNLKVLLIQDNETKKPAAALAVGVGAGGDPAELPGLAHFTEHMSMQGSDFYPEDNAYKK